MTILAFFDHPDHQKYHDSDAERQKFARNLLVDFRFLYKHTEDPEKKVCD